MRNAEKGAFYNSTLKIIAGVGTLAMLATPVSAERKKDVIDCRTGAYQNTEILNIADGQSERISSPPNSLSLQTRQSGSVVAERRDPLFDQPMPLIVGTKDQIKDQMKTGEVAIYVPGTVILQGFKKYHEITVLERNRENTGTIAVVKGVCPDNAPRK